jgi:hypothetical protein
MRLRAGLLASSAIFTLLIGSEPAPAGNVVQVDACGLVSQAELSAATGMPMSPVKDDLAHTQACTWASSPQFTSTGQRRTPYLLVTLSVNPFFENMYQAEAYRVGKDHVVSVSDLGEEAYYATYGSRTVLNAKKGDIYVELSCIGALDHQVVLDAEKSIVAQVLSEL